MACWPILGISELIHREACSLGWEGQWHDYPQVSALDRDGDVQHVLISELHSKPLGFLSPATKVIKVHLFPTAALLSCLPFMFPCLTVTFVLTRHSLAG